MITNDELADALMSLEADDAASKIILLLAAERLRNAPSVSDSAGRVAWNGGACPVARGMLIDVRRRNGEEKFSRQALNEPFVTAEEFWRNDDHAYDIVAYRFAQ